MIRPCQNGARLNSGLGGLAPALLAVARAFAEDAAAHHYLNAQLPANFK
jgi:hypothetical protein